METIANKKHYLTMKIANQTMMVSIFSIKSILPMMTLQEIPHDISAFSGILNFHGQGIPVYDLLSLINPNEKIIVTIDTPILLTNIAEANVAFILSEIGNLLEIEDCEFQKPMSLVPPYVSAIYQTEKIAAWVLDLTVLYHHFKLEKKYE